MATFSLKNEICLFNRGYRQSCHFNTSLLATSNEKGEEMENRRFTEIDEEFICENCGKKVQKLGYSCRDHCPYCLHSKHIDKNPGDRQETCHGDLEPISLEIDGKKGYVIIYKCKTCGTIRKNKAAKDDNMDLIIDLSCKQI